MCTLRDRPPQNETCAIEDMALVPHCEHTPTFIHFITYIIFTSERSSGSQLLVLTRFVVRRRRIGSSWETLLNEGCVGSLAAFRGQKDMGKIGYQGHRAFYRRPDLVLGLRGHPDLVLSLSLTCLFFKALLLGSLRGHCPLVNIRRRIP